MRDENCHTAVEHMMAYLQAPGLGRSELARAIDHIRDCSYCRRRLGHLALALSIDEEDTLTCQECQDSLPEYLLADAEGQAEETPWRSVSLHLQTCPHCSAAYAILSDLNALAFGKGGVEPPHYPEPDLSFLSTGEVPEKTPWHLDELGRLIIAFSTGLLSRLQPQRPAIAAAGLKSDEPKILFQYHLEDAEDLEVTIIAEEKRGDPDRCIIAVGIDIPSRGGWPNLADTEVILKRGEQSPIAQFTNPFGHCVFEGIAVDDLPNLVFEITTV